MAHRPTPHMDPQERAHVPCSEQGLLSTLSSAAALLAQRLFYTQNSIPKGDSHG